MSANIRFMPFPPEAIFAILADADRYADWVVGAKASAETDQRWPEPGSIFHHQQGVGPVHVTDTTTVMHVEPPLRIEMEARVRPMVVAHVSLTIAPAAGGSLVRMQETIAGGMAKPFAALLDPLVHRRNARGLRRLEMLAAEISATPVGSAA